MLKNLREGKYDLTNENRKILYDFDEHNKQDGLTLASRLNYLTTISLYMRSIGKKHVSKSTQKDIDNFLKEREKIAKDKGKPMMPATFNNYRARLCFFGKWLNGILNGVEEYPEWVMHLRNIKRRGRQAKNNAKIVKLNPELLLTPEEVVKVVRCASSTRSKCLIYLTFDSGCRINEVLNIRKKDIEFNERYCKIKIRAENSKNRTERDVFISRAVPVLNEWTSQHHFWDKLDNPYLFVEVHFMREDKPIGKETAMQKLKGAAKKAYENGFISKEKCEHVTLHSLRHSRVTEDAIKGTPISIANRMYGWSKTSQMYLHYTDIVDTTVEEWFKKERLGIKSSKIADKEIVTAQTCPRCGKISGLEKKMCICGWVYDSQEAEKQMSMQEQINELRKLIEDKLVSEKITLSDKEQERRVREEIRAVVSR